MALELIGLDMVIRFYKIFLIILILTGSISVSANSDIIDMMLNTRKNQSTTKDATRDKKESYKQRALKDKNLKQNTELTYSKKKTHRIRLSTYITTTIVLPKDEKIISFNLGDNMSFSGNHSKNIPNILFLNTLENGIYTNLTIITESQRIYTFTLFSIKDEKWQTPHYIVYINHDKEELKEMEDKNLGNINKEEIVDNKDDSIDNRNYNYVAKTPNFFLSEEQKKMMPEEIYDDGKFTYIKLSDSTRLPTIYEVIDGYDEITNYKIIDNNIAQIETISDTGFSLKNGDITICIRKQNDI